MKVILAKKAGFCMGVRRAVDATLETVQNDDQQVATYGPLIHNPQVLDLLHDRGVEVLNDLPEKQDGVIIIRAHGVPPAHKKRLAESGAKHPDAMLRYVKGINAGGNLETRNIRTGITENKPAKPYMIENSVRYFAHDLIEKQKC